MSVVPVEVAGDGEIGVQRGGVGDVADEGVDVGGVGGEPGRVQVADYRGGVDEVAVAGIVSFGVLKGGKMKREGGDKLEVMIVVVSVTEIFT
jgi:hypothetical protein